ncbi:RimJ/RimL family protein N-acetyltransferase [Providencia alcalifaciens]|nr:RimJ/RimL family protein N-acetyltransferase [Providencia alcalifaciens]
MAWFWTIRRKKDPSVMIGLIYLKNKQDDNRGFWLVPELQGQGYMTEACNIVTDFWFNTLNKKVLRVFKATANEASKRMSINMSMRRVDVVKKFLIEGELDCDIWELTKQEWNELAKITIMLIYWYRFNRIPQSR